MALGGDGAVSVIANQVPASVSEMVEAALADDWRAARAIHYRLLPLMRANFVETNPIPVKTALEMMGRGPAYFRAPLCEMAAENRETLRKALEEAGIVVSETAEGARGGDAGGSIWPGAEYYQPNAPKQPKSHGRTGGHGREPSHSPSRPLALSQSLSGGAEPTHAQQLFHAQAVLVESEGATNAGSTTVDMDGDQPPLPTVGMGGGGGGGTGEYSDDLAMALRLSAEPSAQVLERPHNASPSCQNPQTDGGMQSVFDDDFLDGT